LCKLDYFYYNTKGTEGYICRHGSATWTRWQWNWDWARRAIRWPQTRAMTMFKTSKNWLIHSLLSQGRNLQTLTVLLWFISSLKLHNKTDIYPDIDITDAYVKSQDWIKHYRLWNGKGHRQNWLTVSTMAAAMTSGNKLIIGDPSHPERPRR